MTLAEIYAKARKFESRIQRRNAIEYVACGIVLVGFAPALLFGPNWMLRAGAGWIMLATVWVGWQLHRRASTAAPAGPDETLVDAYRRQLIRQREALRSVGSWYLAPLAPGLALMVVGSWFHTPKPGIPIERVYISILIYAVLCVALFVWIWRRNLRGAKRLQKMIDDL
jgi:hypothetical protein